MATKRDLTLAQQHLNAMAGNWFRSQTFLFGDSGPDPIKVPDYDLFKAYRAWDQVRRDLEGPGINGLRDTSRAAALPNQGTWRRQVLDTVTAHFSHFGVGMTTDLIESRLKRPHQSISPRVHELEHAGLLVDSGTRAETRNGTEAIVYVPSQAAIDMYTRSHAGEAT